MTKPQFSIDISGTPSPLEAHDILTMMSDEGCFHEQVGLRLPLGLYNVSISRVTDKVMRLCGRIEAHLNSSHTSNPRGEMGDTLLEIIDYVELSLYAAAEHVDDITSIATGFFKHQALRDKNPAYRALSKAIKQHKHFIAAAANAIKHQQSRVRLASIPFEDQGHRGVLHGYFIEAVVNGVVAPSPTFHRSRKLFSLTSLAWAILIFLLLASRDLAVFLNAVGVQLEGPARVSCVSFTKAVVAAARLPIYDFGEPHPFSLVTLSLGVESSSSGLIDSGIYGSIRNGWSPTCSPIFGNLASHYEGDGKSQRFEFFTVDSVSLQHWS